VNHYLQQIERALEIIFQNSKATTFKKKRKVKERRSKKNCDITPNHT
jgi:hypothetical protein